MKAKEQAAFSTMREKGNDVARGQISFKQQLRLGSTMKRGNQLERNIRVFFTKITFCIPKCGMYDENLLVIAARVAHYCNSYILVTDRKYSAWSVWCIPNRLDPKHGCDPIPFMFVFHIRRGKDRGKERKLVVNEHNRFLFACCT